MLELFKQWSTYRGVAVAAAVALPQLGVVVEGVDAVATAAALLFAGKDLMPDKSETTE